MTREQMLLISLLFGKALDAILTKVSGMDDRAVEDAIVQESLKTDRLLKEMHSIGPALATAQTVPDELTTHPDDCTDPVFVDGYCRHCGQGVRTHGPR